MKYDVIVIGAGSGGLVVAIGANTLGKKVLVIEEDSIGGDCTHYGCVPSKTLIKQANVMHTVKNAKKYGITVSKPRFSWKNIQKHVEQTVDDIYAGETPGVLRNKGISVAEGEAELIDEHTVKVGEKRYRGEVIVIATGATPRVPAIPGLEKIRYHTNKTIFYAKEQPKVLGILGAGPIGIELGQAFARFGTQVHVIDTGKNILGREDPEVSKYMQEILEKEGMTFHLKNRIMKITKSGGKYALHLRRKKKVIVDELLIAAGRVPRPPKGFDTIGLDLDVRGALEVDDKMRTKIKNIYACGDVASHYQFTHVAEQQGRTILANAFLPLIEKKAQKKVIPRVTYTDPEIASVGDVLSKARTYTTYMEDNDRAKTEHNTKGIVKISTKKFSGKIIGATIVAPNAGDMINEISLAMQEGISIRKLSSLIHPYPTRSLGIRNAADKYWKETIAGVFKK